MSDVEFQDSPVHDRSRDRERERDTSRHREAPRDRDAPRDREALRDREVLRDREAYRDREVPRERERLRDREREFDRSRDRERGRDRDLRERENRRERSLDNEEEVEPGRAVFVGNIEQYCRVDDLEDLFSQKGAVRRVDLKQGYAFVFMESGQREAVRAFDGYQLFGRRLKVELARGDGLIKKREDERRREAQQKPCETLFVVNFDPIATQHRDLEKIFLRHGEIKRIEMKRNFAFVQYATAEEATKALEALNGYRLHDRTINVEFVARGQDDSRLSRKRERSPSPRRRDSPPRRPRRSPSPRARPPRLFSETRSHDDTRSRGYEDPYPDRERDRDRDRDRFGRDPPRGGSDDFDDRYRYRN